ncbi:MAG: hypothetical protein R2760_10190 [Chitinophagales bacterium]
MLAPVEYYYPKTRIEKNFLDKLLSLGYFRTANYMLRTRVMLYNSELYNLFHIRYELKTYLFPKSLRKLYNKNSKSFYHKIGPFVNTKEKEFLFSKHQVRFKGSNTSSLHKFLFDCESFSIFNTYQVEIFDKSTNQLVAYSVFDVGTNSLASILGIFDSKYEAFSLGLYSMILEVQYGQEKNFNYYYPGYIADKPSPFNYKTRLGKRPEYYNWFDETWHILDDIENESKVWDYYNTQLSIAEDWLKSNQIPYIRTRNPYYYMDYYYIDHISLSSIEQLLVLDFSMSGTYFVVEYNSEKNCTIIAAIQPNILDEDDAINMNDLIQNKNWRTLMLYKHPMYIVNNANDIKPILSALKKIKKNKDE